MLKLIGSNDKEKKDLFLHKEFQDIDLVKSSYLSDFMLIFDFLDQDFLLLNLKIFSQFYFFPKARPHFNLLICQISLLIEKALQTTFQINF